MRTNAKQSEHENDFSDLFWGKIVSLYHHTPLAILNKNELQLYIMTDSVKYFESIIYIRLECIVNIIYWCTIDIYV